MNRSESKICSCFECFTIFFFAEFFFVWRSLTINTKQEKCLTWRWYMRNPNKSCRQAKYLWTFFSALFELSTEKRCLFIDNSMMVVYRKFCLSFIYESLYDSDLFINCSHWLLVTRNIEHFTIPPNVSPFKFEKHYHCF